MSTPVRDSTSASLSANGSPSRRARARPTAVLPEPIGPIRNTLRLVGCKVTVTLGSATLPWQPAFRQRGLSPLPRSGPMTPPEKTTAARRRPSRSDEVLPRSVDRGALAQDLGRHEDQQLVAV